MKPSRLTCLMALSLAFPLNACNTVAAPVSSTSKTPQPPSVGAYASGEYRNLLSEWNPELTQAQIQAKLNAAWTHFFTGNDSNARLYYAAGSNANGPLAQIRDVANNDVRTEGISYGMMIAVQMNKQAEFDALWNWAYSKMRHGSGPALGYFSWHTDFSGMSLDPNPAPDGEEYLAMALFFASGRWGDKAGIYDYRAQADAILNVMLHKEDMNGGVIGGVTNMFGSQNQVVFVPDSKCQCNTFTDPSYHVPAFYELFGQWASGYTDQAADRQRWESIAAASRDVLFGKAVSSVTGLSPDYTEFDGTPKAFGGNHDVYAYDAWRVGMNWGMDDAWFARQPQEKIWADRLQAFMDSEGVDFFSNVYTLDGKPQDTYHDTGHIAMLASAGLAATDARAYTFVEALWNAPLPSGQYRYYSGLLYMLGLLNVSGQYRIYAPQTP